MIVSASTIMLSLAPTIYAIQYMKGRRQFKEYMSPATLCFYFNTWAIMRRLVPLSMFICHPVLFTDASVLLLLCHVCLCMLSCLFLATLRLPAGKRLTSYLSCVWCFLVFCHFPIWCPGSAVVLDLFISWYLPYSWL